MISIATPTDDKLDRLLAELADRTPTYPEVGATGGPLPPGYRHDHHKVVVGAGDDDFRRAVTALDMWVPHERAGFRVHPRSAPTQAGSTVVGVLQVGPLAVIFGWRIVYVVSEPGRYGFAYGTLPGHPERGEERFLVALEPDGTVSYELVAFSKPVGLARLGSLVARRIQVDVTNRYLRAMQEFVREGSP